MFDFFRRLFFSSDFMPHGHCYLWRPEVLWLHVIADGLIALAYYSIPVALFYFVRRRRSMAFDWMFIMFGVFICACGTTHVLEIVTVWRPVYRLEGLIKAITAAASLTTAVALWRLIPRMLSMPSPRQLHESNRRLEREVTNRKAIEEELRRSRDELDERVQLRTAELRTEIQAREQAREEAERANRAKSEFLSRMSHELRTPLNAIIGFGQLLEMGAQNPRQRENVFHILKGGKHLLGLINEVLDIARIESGRLDMTLESVSVTQVFTEAVALIEPLAAQRKVRVGRIDGAADLFIRADRQRLSQVVLNLLSNAVKYNRVGGSVGLSCTALPDGRRRLGISDTGPGISPADQSRLFIPFERLGAETSTVEGTGIGLALSKRLVEAMGGRIGVESVEGQGSTFFFELPAADQEASQNEIAVDGPFLPPPTVETQPKVLYIEDNLSNFTLVERALEAKRPGVRLLGAMQGQLGLDMASEHRPDLILLDLQLPDIPGDELLRRLQADEKTRHIPVVMVSADATQGQVRRLLALGARSYLTKPLDLRVFLETFDDALAVT